MARWRQTSATAQPPQSASHLCACFTQPKQPNPESLYRSLQAAIRGRPPSAVMHNGRTDAANRLTPLRHQQTTAIPPCSNRWKTVCHRLPIRLPIRPKGRLKNFRTAFFHVSNIRDTTRGQKYRKPRRNAPHRQQIIHQFFAADEYRAQRSGCAK